MPRKLEIPWSKREDRTRIALYDAAVSYTTLNTGLSRGGMVPFDLASRRRLERAARRFAALCERYGVK